MDIRKDKVRNRHEYKRSTLLRVWGFRYRTRDGLGKGYTMITKDQAMTANMFYDVSEKNRDGSPVRWRRNGKTKTWKTRPDDFRIPVKHGLYDYGTITQDNADSVTV